MRTNKVEMRHANVWTCDECGRDNFEYAVAVEPGTIEHTEWVQSIQAETYHQNEVLDEIGITSGGTFYRCPSSVKCKHCSAEFETEE